MDKQENITDCLVKNNLMGRTKCDELQTKTHNRAFKVRFPYTSREVANRSDFCPTDVLI
jgi:hypothetical protein